MVSFNKASVGRSFAALALVLGALFVPAVGCSESDSGATSDDIQDASIAFEVIDVVRDGAAPGLTVLKNTADYKAFFGASPAPSVDFQKHWVLHYSLGDKPTSGYGVEVSGVKATGSKSSRTVVLETLETEPDASCVLAQVIENPQVAIRINKQTGAKKVTVAAETQILGCGDYDPCAGQSCGAPCSPCDPADADCVAPAVLLYCDADGVCGPEEPSCDGGSACGDSTCGEGEYCCNESCGICAPYGGACTQEVCEDGGGVTCGGNTCGAGEYCCNESCGICAPEGGACTQQVCN